MFRTQIVVATLLVALCNAGRCDLISTGDYSITPGVPLEIPILMDGDSVQSLALSISAGPDTLIRSVRYTETIWSDLPLITFEGVPLPASASIFNAVVNQQNTAASLPGAVAHITFETSAPPGTVIPIDLNYSGLSDAADEFSIPIDLTFRHGSLTSVPEPGAGLFMMIGLLFCFLPYFFALRK